MGKTEHKIEDEILAGCSVLVFNCDEGVKAWDWRLRDKSGSTQGSLF